MAEQNVNRFKTTTNGLTLIELMIAMAIMGILVALAVPGFISHTQKAREACVIQEIGVMQIEITAFEIDNGRLPVNLGEINWGSHRDPWGNPYQYHSLDNVPKGQWRKDKFLVPINSAFDLWSMGPDGKSVAPLTAKSSRDDIIFANDGQFIGRASSY